MPMSSSRATRLAESARTLAAKELDEDNAIQLLNELVGLSDTLLRGNDLDPALVDALDPSEVGELKRLAEVFRMKGGGLAHSEWPKLRPQLERAATILDEASKTMESAPSTLPPTPGMERVEDWELLRPLDGGGQGDVVLARNTVTGQLGAFKRLRKHLAADARAIERFRREIQAFEDLAGHPGIALLLGSSREEPPWFVTEWAQLGTLQKHLIHYRGDGLRVLRVARDIAGALEAAHAREYVHRDVKPSNLLVFSLNRVALADFGIAYSSEATRVTTERPARSRWYSPPEAGEGLDRDPAPSFDVYMLGKVIYTMICGGDRFHGQDFVDGDNEISHRLGLPHLFPITSLLERMIQPEPAKRFQAMSEVVTAIDETTAAVMHLLTRRSLVDVIDPEPASPSADSPGTVVTLERWRGGDDRGPLHTTLDGIDHVRPSGYAGRFDVFLRGDRWYTVEGDYKEFFERWRRARGN